MTDNCNNCYYEFDLLISDCDSFDAITLLGYWRHSDGESGVDEIADFLVTEYKDFGTIRSKAEWMVGLLNKALKEQDRCGQ